MTRMSEEATSGGANATHRDVYPAGQVCSSTTGQSRRLLNDVISRMGGIKEQHRALRRTHTGRDGHYRRRKEEAQVADTRTGWAAQSS